MEESSGGGLKYFSLLKQDPVEGKPRDCHGIGRVNVSLLQQILPLDDNDFYLRGPDGFM